MSLIQFLSIAVLIVCSHCSDTQDTVSGGDAHNDVLIVLISEHATFCGGVLVVDGTENLYNLAECASAVQSTAGCDGGRFQFTELSYATQGNGCICQTNVCNTVIVDPTSPTFLYEIQTVQIALAREHADVGGGSLDVDGLDHLYNLVECAEAVRSNPGCHGGRFQWMELSYATQGRGCKCETSVSNTVNQMDSSHPFSVYDIQSPCLDDPAYVDPIYHEPCSSWGGSTFGFDGGMCYYSDSQYGFTAAQKAELFLRCPVTCGVCKAKSAPNMCLSREDCEAAAANAGLEIGGGDYAFAGDYGTKGCFAYSSGEYEGIAYFGTGGTQSEMAASVASPKYRISCAPENQIPLGRRKL